MNTIRARDNAVEKPMWSDIQNMAGRQSERYVCVKEYYDSISSININSKPIYEILTASELSHPTSLTIGGYYRVDPRQVVIIYQHGSD